VVPFIITVITVNYNTYYIQPFYSCYTDQPGLVGTSVKNWRVLSKAQLYCLHTIASAFPLGRCQNLTGVT